MVEQDIRVGCFTSSGQMGTKVAFPAKAVLHVPTELDSGGLWLPSTETYKQTSHPGTFRKSSPMRTLKLLWFKGVDCRKFKTPQLAGGARLRLQG